MAQPNLSQMCQCVLRKMRWIYKYPEITTLFSQLVQRGEEYPADSFTGSRRECFGARRSLFAAKITHQYHKRIS